MDSKHVETSEESRGFLVQYVFPPSLTAIGFAVQTFAPNAQPKQRCHLKPTLDKSQGCPRPAFAAPGGMKLLNVAMNANESGINQKGQQTSPDQ